MSSPRSLSVDRHPGQTRSHRRRRSGALGALGLAVVVWGTVLAGTGARARPAQATAVHRVGFEATVLGWTSWYGSYDLGPIGAGWCIDHGLAAPDAAFDYRPSVPADLRDDTRAAMAWAVTTADAATDPVRSAALMLVLHDLRGAVYPYGRLDVDTLTTAQLAGFGGQEAAVIAQAQAIKADAVAHAGRRGPLRLVVQTQGTGPASGQLVASLTDADGSAIGGASVTLGADGAALGTASSSVTGPDGKVTAPFDLPAGWTTGAGPAVITFTARVVAPDPTLSAWAPSTVAAQRVVIPAWVTLTAATQLTRPPTSTTSTTRPKPTTTTSTRPKPTTTTTTRPKPTTTTSTRPKPTTTTTRPKPTTTTTSSPPAPPPTAAPATTTPTTVPATNGSPTTTTTVEVGQLPVTGAPSAGWALIGLGLVLVGAALVRYSQDLGRSEPGRPPADRA